MLDNCCCHMQSCMCARLKAVVQRESDRERERASKKTRRKLNTHLSTEVEKFYLSCSGKLDGQTFQAHTEKGGEIEGARKQELEQRQS